MERMEKLKNQSNEELLEEIMADGNIVSFTSEQIAESRERYNNFGKTGKIEKMVRREQVFAAAQPDVYLTF